MQDALVFSGSGLDRAAELRGDAAALADALAAGRVIALWRGKPLVDGSGLARLDADHPVFAGEAAVLLGREEDGACIFARDLSDWVPDEIPDTLGAFRDPSRQEHPRLPGAAFAELRGEMTRLSARDAELAATARAILGWHRTHGCCAVCGAVTRPTEGGWQRVCDDCDARHFPRTDPVVIMLVVHGNDVLVGRSPAWPEGFHSLLAGFVEPGETIEAAVRREVHEETQVRVGPVAYVASQPWAFPMSLMLGCAARAESRAITRDPVELSSALWISREDMVEVMAGRHPTLRPPREGAIARWLLEGWLAGRISAP